MNASNRYYFAYGSNMDPERMQKRFKKGIKGKQPVNSAVVKIGLAKLPNYSIAFAGNSENWGGATATLIPKADSYAPGVLYITNPEQEEVLTWVENADLDSDPFTSNSHKKINVLVDCDDGNSYPAYTFVNTSKIDWEPPTEKYLNTIKNAYHEMSNEVLVRNFVKRLFGKTDDVI